jgi:hypothetical protein
MAATNSADGREAITDDTLQSNSQGNLIESIVIILAELVTPEPTCFPAGMFRGCDRWNNNVATSKISE